MRLRSLLFVPGDRPDQMQKALGSGADALILDLEDSVAAARRERACEDVAAFLQRAPRPTTVFVRINPPAAGRLERDLDAIETSAPEGIVLPKAAGAASVRELQRCLVARGLSSLRILPIATETPAAVFRLAEYGEVADCLAGLTWGAEDLSAALGATSARTADGQFTAPYEMVRGLLLFAAHAAGVAAIDTVYPAFRDHEGLVRYARAGARDGFSGMMAIHPSQVSIINEAFTPSDEVVQRARRVVQAFADRPAAGVLTLDGEMIDAPHLKLARRVLAQVGESDAGGV